MRIHRGGMALLIVGLVIGCSGQSPARIALQQNTFRLLDRKQVPLQATLVTASGKPLTKPALTYSATPANIVAVDPNGAAECRSTGDAVVVVAGGGHSASISISCRLVTKIETPSSLRLTTGEPAVSPGIRLLDERGVPITDVQVSLNSSDPRVARVDANTAVAGITAGTATVTFTAGEAQAVTHVSVFQLIQSAPVALADGASSTWTLQRGSYELDLTVAAADGRANGVTVTWVGVECPRSIEAQRHRMQCEVPGTASVTVENPSMLGLGPAVTGFMNLYRTQC
jgi:hypothetical protein